MNIPESVVNAIRSYLEQLRDLQPEVQKAQDGILAELDKGSSRNLLDAIDPVIAVGSKHMSVFTNFIAAGEGEEIRPYREQLGRIVSAAATGNFESIEGLPADVIELMRSNHVFNQALKESIESKHGPEAMTRALQEDGLVAEFQRRSKEQGFG